MQFNLLKSILAIEAFLVSSLLLGYAISLIELSFLIQTIFSILLYVLLLMAVIFNIFVYHKHKDKYNKKNLPQLLMDFRTQSEENTLNYDSSFEDLKTYYKKNLTYVVSLFVVGVFMLVLFLSMLINHEASRIDLLLVGIYIEAVLLYTFINHDNHIVGKKVTRKHFPKLFDVIDQVRSEVGFKRKIHVYVTGGVMIGVNYINYKHIFIIGLEALMLLNEEELKSIFIHELGHIYHKDTKISSRQFILFEGYTKLGINNGLTILIKPLFFGLANYYAIMQNIHQVIISKTKEERADEMVKIHGYNVPFIHGSLKLMYFSFFDHKYGVKAYTNVAENLSETFIDDLFMEFRESLVKNEETYRTLVKNELTSKRTSHPTLHERMMFFDCEDYTITPCDVYDLEEVNRLKSEFQMTNEFQKSGYIEERQQTYLKFLKTIENHDINQKDAVSAMSYLEALFLAYRVDEAYQFAKEQILANPHLAYPHYVKGVIDTQVYLNFEGIDDLIKAAQLDFNFQQSIEIAAEFNRFSGNQEKHDELRQVFFSIFQDNMNKNLDELHRFNRRTKFQHVVLDQDIFNHLKEIVNEGSFKQAFVVKQMLNRDYHVIRIFCTPGDDLETFHHRMDQLHHYTKTLNDHYMVDIMPNLFVWNKLKKYGTPLV